MKSAQTRCNCPESDIHWSGGLVGLLSLLFALYWYASSAISHPEQVALVLLLAIALPVVATEVLTGRQSMLLSLFKRGDKRFQPNFKRIGYKLIALLAIYALIALAYWVFPEYRSERYFFFFDWIKHYALWLCVVAPVYVWLTDGLMWHPKDSYYDLGRWLLKKGQFKQQDFVQLSLGWLVKAFFLPLMVGAVGSNIQELYSGAHTFDTISKAFGLFYNVALPLILMVDVLFATVGYVMSLRLFDAHIRSTDSTALGWLVALSCYPPFNSIILGLYFANRYGTDHGWMQVVEPGSAIFIVWALAILFLAFIYTLATVAFGIRFSNLTHRGIITSGVYRLGKHPAYLCKNLMWWLLALPVLISLGSWVEVIQGVVMLLGVNLVYYFRAKTEERHLSQDLKYQEYAQWVARFGLVGRLRNLFRLPQPRPR